MKRKVFRLFILFTLLFGLLFGSSTAFANQGEIQMIRIGVVPDTANISIGSNTNFTISDKVTGETLFTGSNQNVNVSLESTSAVETNYRLQTAFTTSALFRDDWLGRAAAEGYETYVEPYNNGWRLLIGKFPADAPWSVREAFRQEIISKGLAASDAYWRIITISEGETSIKLSADGFEATLTNPIVLVSDNNLVKIGNSNYRGIAEVNFNSAGTLAAINELPLEDYLYGVVPRELPPEPYGELEAQKAQAVAARTYAYANLGKRARDGYDLLPTTSDQVYGGYDAEHPVSTQAVNETAGVVATYNGELITAVYHSTSGGYTANNEDVWSSEPIPYLRGVPDAPRGKALENVKDISVFKNNSDAISLRNSANGDYESEWSRYHRWYVEWTAEEISNVLSTSFNTDVGEVYEINVLERANSGRVLAIEFVTENGTFYEYEDRIRTVLKYVTDSGTQSSLRSTLFYIEPVIDHQSNETVGFKAYGGGWGHGVGLSQTGAVGMAAKGKSYEEILKYYYQGIELEVR